MTNRRSSNRKNESLIKEILDQSANPFQSDLKKQKIAVQFSKKKNEGACLLAVIRRPTTFE
jgi:hypothetical protein